MKTEPEIWLRAGPTEEKKKKKKKKLACHITSIETELHIFEHLLTNINWTIKDNQTNCFLSPLFIWIS